MYLKPDSHISHSELKSKSKFVSFYLKAPFCKPYLQKLQNIFFSSCKSQGKAKEENRVLRAYIFKLIKEKYSNIQCGIEKP